MTGELDYGRMVKEALRGVVGQALRSVAEGGLPGEHHFFVSFRTDHPGVVLPAVLKRQYPEEMTIVLQHQFWNLEVEAASFSVDLRFGGTLSRVTVPFAALTAFADPSVEFGLRFDGPAEEGLAAEEPAGPPPAAAGPAAEPATAPADGNVVDIRSFRRKN